ncbi:oxidoreductase [Pseudoduganella lutea]|uniref:SDR family NAD(P)-dependent oxidoreductase n=1 Tax=Pseudoduganella lutea TaxID=321985 RepID=A0A4P6L1I8_9BURK|nr:oxidoreductase [Pseudoduganella lutea]QBE65396.1 SDR family NAD(P)-dependent oxidoreductase [Pseudoduganella lutea]
MNQHATQVWLITGCSTGFGRSLASHLLDSGRCVVATARKPEQLEEFKDRPNALLLPMDVTEAASVERCVAAALERFGHVDVLVNNAGTGYFAAAEESDEDDVRAMFEVNFFGTARTIHALLPHLRQRRSGTIVNLTSVGGFIGYPAVGYYCASKFAVEGLSDALRTELAPLGIHVMTVEPSAFRTEWAGASAEPESTIADYDATAGAARRAYRESVGHQAGDPARAARAIAAAVEAERPPGRLLLGNEAVDEALKRLETLRRDFIDWESVARGADFPQD